MLLQNPFLHPLFVPTLVRLTIVLGIGAVLVVGFNFRKVSETFRSPIWARCRPWLLMLPPFLASVFCGRLIALVLIGTLTCLAVKDYCRLLCLPRFFFRVMLFNTFFAFGLAIMGPIYSGALPFAFFLIITLLAVLRDKVENILNRVALTLFGSIWLVFSMIHFIRIGLLPQGTISLIILGFAIACSDVMAFVFGSFSRRLLLAHHIAEHASYLSVLGNVVGALIGFMLFVEWVPVFSFQRWVFLSVVIGFSVALGDLVFAVFKRYLILNDDTDDIEKKTHSLQKVAKMLIPAVMGYWILLHIG